MLALRLILVLIIAASAGVIALGELKLKPHLDDLAQKQKKTADDLAKEQQERSKQETRAKSAEQQRDALDSDLKAAKQSEADAMKAAQAERDKAVAAAQETNKAKQETAKVRAEANDYFELQKLGLTPPVIRRINDDLPKATNELTVLKQEQKVTMVQLTKKSGELNALLNPAGKVVLPTGLNGKVTVVDHKWNFIVLDIGANHGLLPNGEMTIHREGKLVSRVKLAKVDTDYAIANVMSGYKQSDIREGDAVLTPDAVALPPQKK